jgi:hypothetical protein
MGAQAARPAIANTAQVDEIRRDVFRMSLSC